MVAVPDGSVTLNCGDAFVEQETPERDPGGPKQRMMCCWMSRKSSFMSDYMYTHWVLPSTVTLIGIVEAYCTG